jgi:hypothetical protein
MAKTDRCAARPAVINKNSKKTASKLYDDLLAFVEDRKLASQFYLMTKNEGFYEQYKDLLEWDDNNEPTFISLYKKSLNLRTVVPETRLLTVLNKKIGYYKKGADREAMYIDNYSNREKLQKKADEFNESSEFNEDYYAKVVNVYDNESPRRFIGVKVVRKNKMYALEVKQLEYNKALNEKLRSILAQVGVSVGALNNLEERLGYSGVTDFDSAKTTAEGLLELIRIANGERGEKALPEEFAHFAIEALGDNPLVNRLINLIHSSGLTQQIIGDSYDEYVSQYNNDTYKLAKEAAGKLLAKHLLENESYEHKPYKNIIARVIQAIKDFFRKLSFSEIKRALYEADKEFGDLAKNILTGNLTEKMSISNIDFSGKLYQLDERVLRDKKILQNIIKNELKRLKIYEQRSADSSFDVNQHVLIAQLEKDLSDNIEIEGIYSFMENALAELTKINSRLSRLSSLETDIPRERAFTLRNIRNYIYSYKNIIQEIRKAIVDEEKFEDNRYGERGRMLLNELSNLIKDLEIEYNNLAMPLFVDFLKPFLGDSLEVPFGKYKGQKLDLQKMIEVAEEDISFFDRWLDSMADSSDHVLKLMDQAVKKSKENARLSTIDITKQLQEATIRLEKAGYTDTSWMFEKDSKGNLSGRYITEINKALFEEERRKEQERLKNKYGENPTGNDEEAYKKELRQWYLDNTEYIDKERRPKLSKYANTTFKNLSDAQKKYYDTVMKIKSTLDSYLPASYTYLTNSVKIRKDLIERLKDSKDVKSGAISLWESIKDNFIRNSNDTEFGSKAAVKDFEGNIVQLLPIYYTKLREGESNNDISTDIVSTLSAYAAMANDYHEMNKVIDLLELGRDVLRNREITLTQGGKTVKETFTELGRKVESTVLKRGNESNFIGRLNDFFDMQVYGRYMADEGTFGKSSIDKAKTANFVNRVTALNSLALNILSSISNVATGSVMMKIESHAKEFFTPSNVARADRIYGTQLPEYLAEIGSRIKTNKLALWNELFDTLQEYDKEIKNVNFDRKKWYSKMFSTNTLFFLNNSGEHWMQTRTSLALADSYKMKSPEGKVVSLWDAMEVVYADPSNKKLGAKLQVKKGYTKENGDPFTNADIISFSRKAAAINQRMHGIYNKADRNAFQKLALGRMAMMFRKWIKPSLRRRYGKATYNYDLQSWVEGYYITAGRFLKQLALDLKESQFTISASWDNLSKQEQANIKRALTEVGFFLSTVIVLGVIDWPDNDDDVWLVRMLEYQTRRLHTELGSLIIGPSMVQEGLKIIKSPAAGINTIENALDLIGLINPYNYEFFGGEEALVKSGRYKGKNKATKLFFESPLVPMNKTLYKGLHPEEGIPFYKQ